MKSVLITVAALIATTVILITDWNDRTTSKCEEYYSREESEFFFHYKTVEESQEAIINNCTREMYRFPREQLKSIKLFKNTPIVSRFTSKELNEKQILNLTEIINNPQNYDWIETTWNVSESDYFFRMYNINDEEIGIFWIFEDKKIWSEIKPWVPSTKYGAMTSKGAKRIKALIKKIELM